MNEIWKVLGIAPTSDKRAIRAAYSAMAKQCHPEEDPQGFQMLHEAYQEALAYAAGNAMREGDDGAGSFSHADGERMESGEENRPALQEGLKRDRQTGHGDGTSGEAGKDVAERQPENAHGEEQQGLQPNDREAGNADGEKPQESQPDGGEADGNEQAPSLLARLAQAKEEEVKKSMQSGALSQFSTILNDPKKFRKADAWKAFFLSEDFLREQYQESFADGMLRILENFSTEDNYSITQMPSGFLLELAIAYALVLNSRQSEERAASFYAREVAASIWNMQQTQYSLPLGPLGKPENQVRWRSFADYIRLRDYHSRGLLTRQKEEEWKELVHGGVVNHLYELKGKGRHEIYPQSRSTCLLDLCAFWIRETDDVPECVLEYIYKDYGLRGSEHTSTRKLYEPLKQAILSRYPDIEEALYGEEGRAKMVSEWYKDMMRIISDNERYYEEIKGTKERVRELFARKEWEKIRYLPELFGKVELGLFGRSVMPVSLTKRLMEFFSDETGVKEQVWEKESGEVMTEEMIHSLYYSRIIQDMHGSVPKVTPYFKDGKLWEVYRAEEGCLEETQERGESCLAEEVRKGGDGNCFAEGGNKVSGEERPEAVLAGNRASDASGMGGNEDCPDGGDIIFCTDFYAGYPEVLYHQDFWHYFLMRGFGCRSAQITGRRKFRRKYMVGMSASLPMYIGYLYEPSIRWQKLFTKGCGKGDNKLSDSEKTTVSGEIADSGRVPMLEENQDSGKVSTLGKNSMPEKIPCPKFCRFFTNVDGNIVPGVEFTLPDGKHFRAEFYLHYVRYFLDGEEAFRPVYDFAEYAMFAKSISHTEELASNADDWNRQEDSISRTEKLVFLLAITKISVEDCGKAQELIERLLAQLPLAPVSIPIIARLLAAGVEDEAAGGKAFAGSYSHHISLERAAESTRYIEHGQDEEKKINFLGDVNEGEGNRFCGVFYLEDEELCFRAVVREGGFSVFRQTDFGWEELYTAAFDQKLGENILLPGDKQRVAQEFLQGMKRPAPRLRMAFSLEGLTNEKKAEKILEALKRDARYRGSVHGLLPYAAGYPWNEKDTGRGKFALQDDFKKRGESAGRDEDEETKLAANQGTAQDISGEEKTGSAENDILTENALQRFYREYGGFLPECYCVLRFGKDDTQVKKDHVFYASMKPFGFSLAFRALDWPSSYEHREEELHRKVKEKHWAVGHFGWGDLSEPEGEGLPRIVAVGESGTYYYYDIIRMIRQENLAALLARMFDFSKVVTVENYEGELSISRFGGELEYCYDREAFLQSAYTEGKTAADLFTVFTKAEVMGEFAVYMDGLLGEVTGEPESVYFEFSHVEDGAYVMRVFLWDDAAQEQRGEDCGESGVMQEDSGWKNLSEDGRPLVWKIWKRAWDGAAMSRDFKDAAYWYMECGKFGEKLAGCKRVTVGFDLGDGKELAVQLGRGKEEGMEWYRSRISGVEGEWEGEFEEGFEWEEDEVEEDEFEGEDWE